MNTIQHKTFTSPDETREFGHGKVENLAFSEGVVGKLTLLPGWKWSNDVKPAAGTELCEVAHFAYHVSGRLHVRMADGTEAEFGPNEVSILPAGHDAWVVGDEPVVLFDWTGTTANYAQRS